MHRSARSRSIPTTLGAATQVVATLVALVLFGAACSDDTTTGPTAAGPITTNGDLTGSVTVFAASSLTDAFTALGTAFEAAHAGARVTFNFGASSSLREQILGGAPADVFASANQASVDKVIAAGDATTSSVFATNALEIATPPSNPGKVTGLGDFAEPNLLIGLCAEEVPCGQFGRQALAAAGVTPSVDTNAADARSLLTQIESGDLDAGLVYATDVQAAGKHVRGIEIPAAQNVRADYPITVLTTSTATRVAEAFVAFVASDAGQRILVSYGFGVG
jgi:molybdate transport system substrate-binding protein